MYNVPEVPAYNQIRLGNCRGCDVSCVVKPSTSNNSSFHISVTKHQNRFIDRDQVHVSHQAIKKKLNLFGSAIDFDAT